MTKTTSQNNNSKLDPKTSVLIHQIKIIKWFRKTKFLTGQRAGSALTLAVH